jgi:hypothetical protein
LQADDRSGAGLAGHFEGTADGGGALAHAGEAVVAGFGGWLRRQALAVVTNFKGDAGWTVFKLDAEMGGGGVLADIVDGFLGNAEDFALSAGRKRAVCAEDAELAVEG